MSGYPSLRYGRMLFLIVHISKTRHKHPRLSRHMPAPCTSSDTCSTKTFRQNGEHSCRDCRCAVLVFPVPWSKRMGEPEVRRHDMALYSFTSSHPGCGMLLSPSASLGYFLSGCITPHAPRILTQTLTPTFGRRCTVESRNLDRPLPLRVGQ